MDRDDAGQTANFRGGSGLTGIATRSTLEAAFPCTATKYPPEPGSFGSGSSVAEADLAWVESHAALPALLPMDIPNKDIQDVHNQLERYYEPIMNNAFRIAEKMETTFRQKLELGLYDQLLERINAMKTLVFSRDIETFQFIIVLVDSNKNSSLFDIENIQKLPFAKQVKVFQTGFGVWHYNVSDIQVALQSCPNVFSLSPKQIIELQGNARPSCTTA